MALAQQDRKDPLKDVDRILDLVQIYGGTYVQVSDSVGICIQHIELDAKNNPDLTAENLQLDLREVEGDYYKVLPGTPVYVCDAAEVQRHIRLLIEQFMFIANWLEPSPIETTQAHINRIKRLQYRGTLDMMITPSEEENEEI